MADFKLTDEQKEYLKLARDFAQKEIAPKAAALDHAGGSAEEICRKAWELGIMNLHVPEEFGGLDLSKFDATIISEELSAGCAAIAFAINSNNLAAAPVLVAGNNRQKEEFLGGLTRDFSFASYCVGEDLNDAWNTTCRTQAREVGDEFVISGNKIAVANAASAKWFTVIATTDETTAQTNKHLSCFLIPKDAPGVSVGPRKPGLGLRAFDTRSVSFEETRIPKDNLVGKIGQGWEIALNARASYYPMIAASAAGVARSAMEHAIAYSQQRKTFGVAIATHQAIRLMVADMAKDIDASRLLAQQAAWLVDAGNQDIQASSIAKAFAQEMVMSATTNAVQIFGGYGYSKEYPVEKLMRDAKALQMLEGTSLHEQVNLGRKFAQPVAQ